MASLRALCGGLALLLALCMPHAGQVEAQKPPSRNAKEKGTSLSPPEDAVDFDYKFRSITECEGANNWSCRWKNPAVTRVGRKALAFSVEMEIVEEIPDTHDFTAFVNITNRQGSDRTGQTPVAQLISRDICKTLKERKEDDTKAYIESFRGTFDGRCPIKKGTYKTEKFEITPSRMKPFLRNGIMIFNVSLTHRLKCISCVVFEFDVDLKRP